MHCADCGMRIDDDKVTHCPTCGEALQAECSCGCTVEFRCDCEEEAGGRCCGEKGE